MTSRRGDGRKATRRSEPQQAKPVRVEGGSASKWHTAAHKLEKQIGAGRFQETGRLPTEAALARELGISRHQVRQVIGHLVGKGQVRSVPYMGVFLAPCRIEIPIDAASRFVQAMQDAGNESERRLLSHDNCAPPAEIARRLGVAARTRVIELKQLLMANGVVLGCAITWLPADRFSRVVALLQASGSLRRGMMQMGIAGYRRKRVRIVCRSASHDERRLLELRSNSSVVALEGVSCDDAGEPTHAYDYVFSADRIALVVEP